MLYKKSALNTKIQILRVNKRKKDTMKTLLVREMDGRWPTDT